MKNSTSAVDIESVDADPLAPRKLDFSKGVRGKYYNRMQEGTNVVLIAPDLIESFPDSDSVNNALRKFQAISAAKHA